MKKIFLIPFLFLVLLSCTKSKTDEVVSNNNVIPTELIGTWKFVGYYDDIANAPNDNLHLYNQSFLVTFNDNGTFVANSNGTITNGTYNVDATLIVKAVYNSTAIMPFSLNSLKIYTLTSTFFECYDYGVPNPSGIDYRFEKVLPTQTGHGKIKKF